MPGTRQALKGPATRTAANPMTKVKRYRYRHYLGSPQKNPRPPEARRAATLLYSNLRRCSSARDTSSAHAGYCPAIAAAANTSFIMAPSKQKAPKGSASKPKSKSGAIICKFLRAAMQSCAPMYNQTWTNWLTPISYSRPSFLQYPLRPSIPPAVEEKHSCHRRQAFRAYAEG